MNFETNQDDPDVITKPERLFPLVRHLSYCLTPILLKIPIIPNQVTAISLFCGLLCAVCFLTGNHLIEIIGALLFVLSYTFDNCDGEIARIQNSASELGAKFDDLSDWIVDASFFAALGYGTSQVMEQSFWFWLGLAAAIGAFIDYIVDLHYHAKNVRQGKAKSRAEQSLEIKHPSNKLDWIIYILHKLSRADFCMIVLILSLFNIAWVLLPFAAIGAQAYWVTDLFERARGYRT